MSAPKKLPRLSQQNEILGQARIRKADAFHDADWAFRPAPKRKARFAFVTVSRLEAERQFQERRAALKP